MHQKQPPAKVAVSTFNEVSMDFFLSADPNGPAVTQKNMIKTAKNFLILGRQYYIIMEAFYRVLFQSTALEEDPNDVILVSSGGVLTG